MQAIQRNIAGSLAGLMVLACMLFLAAPGASDAANGSFAIRADTVTGTIGKDFYSINLSPYPCWGAMSNSWYTSNTTARTRAAAQKYGVLRVVGGDDADSYHWWNGTFTSNTGFPANVLTPDVFGKFAETVGSKLMITCNGNRGYDWSGVLHPTWMGTSLEAANWVEYMNGQVPATPDPAWTTSSYAGNLSAPIGYFAWLRAQRGHAAPYNVRDWEVGNENYLAYNPNPNEGGGYGQYVEYADTCATYYDAMHARATAVGSIPIYVAAQLLGSDQNQFTWNDTVISRKKYDALIEHYYLGGGSAETDAAITSNFVAMDVMTKTFTNTYIVGLMKKYLSTAKYDSTELWMTETGPDYNYPSDWESLNPWDAVWAARLMAEAQKTTKRYDIFNWYNFSQGDDGYSMVSTSSGQVLPVYWAFDILTHWARGGDTLVRVTGTAANVDVYAAKLADRSLELLVLNKELSATSALTFTITGYTAPASGVSWTYGRAECGWGNTGSRTPCQTPPTQQTATGLGNSFIYTFPAMSVNVLRLAAPVDVRAPVLSAGEARRFAMFRSNDRYIVNAATSGTLSVFSLSGALVVRVAVAAGMTRLELPAGTSALMAKFTDRDGSSSVVKIASVR